MVKKMWVSYIKYFRKEEQQWISPDSVFHGHLKKLLFLLFITFKYGITDVTVNSLSQFSKSHEMTFITGVNEITRDENPPKNVCEKQIYNI